MKGKEDRLSVKSSEPLVVGLDLSSDPRIGEFHPDLFFLPYLTGQRCPGWRDKAKASSLGLTLDTGPEDLLRATLEGLLLLTGDRGDLRRDRGQVSEDLGERRVHCLK